MITVKIGNRTYKYNRDRVAKLLEQASKQCRHGIYAIEHKGVNMIEFVFLPMSTTQIKRYIRNAKKQGIKLYANY